mmetsp:Transcript_83026/g.121599  ORF Transcript_83026/g.121599 Transcript_83026/m.121599 type:complete len:209 (-) Transcript_83026:252-878(-)|eukprot:CAMPEP_0179423880 /NCGR_PEP_ID=MMETSP0799-20121207/11265_1 /TAXON_ID=46947 /ORGANISM="Geminigera cryophila, Strain CCMP2564" /LENGTH=208 /DNA_ID=CAMNT_0021198243 /DNA_START=2257 /DNA_END=2883 /DNA_ORIENTATION=+
MIPRQVQLMLQHPFHSASTNLEPPLGLCSNSGIGVLCVIKKCLFAVHILLDQAVQSLVHGLEVDLGFFGLCKMVRKDAGTSHHRGGQDLQPCTECSVLPQLCPPRQNSSHPASQFDNDSHSLGVPVKAAFHVPVTQAGYNCTHYHAGTALVVDHMHKMVPGQPMKQVVMVFIHALANFDSLSSLLCDKLNPFRKRLLDGLLKIEQAQV